MPASYQFKRADGTAVTLDDIDREMCEDSGYPYSADDYCPRYMTLIEIGFACLMGQGGSHVTVDHVKEIVNRIPELAMFIGPMLKYLAGYPYTFDAWR